MLNILLENLSSLVFPIECEICKISLDPNPPAGVCLSCADDIKKIAPPHCPGCGRTLTGQQSRCNECQNEFYAFDQAFACASYDGPMRSLIHAYKFQRRRYLKHFFIKMAEGFILTNFPEGNFDLVLAVPVGTTRLLERGFNQSELISIEIAKDLHVHHSAGNLIRNQSEATQSLLTKSERKMNVRNAFSIKYPETFKQKKILLIDDILTTGHTASECARVLKEAGVSSVTVLALARRL